MKRYMLAALLPLLLQACTSSGDYKEVRKEVLELHDSVMIDTEKAIRNKMKLDTLSGRMDSLKQADPALDTVLTSQKITRLKSRLDSADEQMHTWMRAFEPEVADRSNDDAVAYFENEKRKIAKLDSFYAEVLKESDQFLSELKNK